jgi:beta-lactamase regulating signal transducer with metallopeptidase domain
MKSNFTCFSETFDYALGWTVIHSLWQAMAIAILMGIALIMLRKKTAKVRYWVANAALLAVLLSAVATFAYYYKDSKVPPIVQFTPDTISPISTTEGTTLAEIENHKSKIQNPNLTWEGFRDYFNQNIPLIVLVWIMGVALFVLKLLGGISYVYYLRSRLNFPADEYWIETLDKLKNKVGVKQSIDLLESALTRTPMVVGHLKPMILFPIGAINKLSPTEVEAILAHEIAHVMRKDFIFNILQSVVEALFYYHPAVWVISSTIRNERENCCDDVAIEICGNSMDYAKALVMVQEMAYYPMFQPAMAFAGNRKNQLLYRVQRILNQPQNKTNVMEKLIATCTLVVVMMGLSFGEKSFANNNVNDKNTPSVETLAETTEGDTSPESPVSPTAPVPPTATFYIYFKDKTDSLKVPTDVISGKYEYNDNIQDAVLTVKDHYVVALKVNNIDLNDDQLPNYKRLIDKIIRNRKSDEGQKGIVDNALDNAGISFQNDGMKMNNDRAKMSIDKNGFQLNGVDDKGQSFNFSMNENGLHMDATGDDGQPVKMNMGKNATTERPQKNTTFINKGILTTFDEKGEKWVIKPENDGIKYIEHFNTSDKLVETIKMQNGKVYINDREATTAELRQKGWEINSMGIQRIGGFSNIQPSQNYNFTNSYSSSKAVENDDNEGDLQEKIEDLKNDIQELRKEIKECDCTANFDFRKGLIERLDRLFPAYKAQNEKVLNAFELRFLEIKNEWERGECDENKKSTGSVRNNGQNNISISKGSNSYGYGTGNSQVESENAKRSAEIARRNAEIARQYANKKREEANIARKDAESQGNTEKAIHSFFQDLLDAGHITSDKKCAVAFNNSQLSVDGKSITGREFDRIKGNFEKALKGKRTFVINLTGKVKQNTPGDLDISGSLTTSSNTND